MPAPLVRATTSAEIPAGGIDCLISGRTPSAYANARLRRLFPDFGAEEKAYFARTRVFPIMHTIVVKRSLVERAPEALPLLMARFASAKALAEALRRGGRWVG